MSTQGQYVRYARGGRRRKDVPDLNVPLAVENLEVSSGPTVSVNQGGQGNVPVVSVAHGGQVRQPARSNQPAPIDVEELDDDDVVVISSPRAFEEAKNRSRRTRRTVVVDVESAEAAIRHGLNQTNKRRRGPANPSIINCEVYVNLEGSSGSKRGARYVAPPPPPPPPPPEPVFSCPACMGPIEEEVTTKCGHIFCKGCIKSAISAQHKCPTCRRKLSNKDLIRVYLPTTKAV
ncbi:uncharacterized protein [Rutidosis leptorrhynchoides]|uniref:uncharacterized protein n=1 Tax=Rutidosis leptorrhynchoides TaxID=125765 RepID=UPI003A99E94D